MMRSCLFLVAALLCVSYADPLGEEPPIEVGEINIVSQVQQEEYIARKYLDIMLRLQHTQATQTAGSLWVKAFEIEGLENNLSALEVESTENRGHVFEENIYYDTDDRDEWENAAQFGSFNAEQAKLDLLASYHLFRAVNMKTYHAIFHVGELQREFFLDRMMQYYIQSAGASVDPQLVRLFYVKIYSTMLKTFRISYNLQYLSHFRTWLENSLDLDVALVSSAPNSDKLFLASKDQLSTNRFYAFHSFHNFAMLDYQIFFVDSYLESVLTGSFGGSLGGSLGGSSLGGGSMGPGSFGVPPANDTASFLEMEEGAEPSQSQFVPFMLYNSSPFWYMKIYKFYFLNYQVQAAQSGLSSSYAERASNQAENAKSAEEVRTQSQRLFTSFAQNLSSAAYLEYLTTIFELYSLFAPTIAGSFAQGSMGAGSV